MSHVRRGLCAVAVFACTQSAAALGQANVPQYRGEYGLLAGTLPPAGGYFGGFYNNYQSNKVVGANGNVIMGFLPAANLGGFQLVYSFPSPAVLGARWASTIIVPWTDIALETPVTPFTRAWGFGDMFVQPMKLGWTFPRADFVVASGVWMPTGRFDANKLGQNTGLGVWGWEQQVGTTLYLDGGRRANASTLASYEVSTDVRGTDRKPGQLVTLEGGIGYQILEEVGQVGLVYYAQWKVSADRNFHLPAEIDAFSRMYGLGPEVTIPFPAKALGEAILTLRYYIETNNRVAPQGDSFWIFVSLYRPHKKHK